MAELLSLEYDRGRIAQSLDLMNTVFTNGCFDVFHPGHLHLLQRCVQRAREMSGIVVVGVDSDASVALRKGPTRPVFPCWHRMNLVGSIKGIDTVIEFHTEQLEELIRLVGPRLVVKGGDYTLETVVSGGHPVEIVETLPGWSTTRVIESLL